MGKVVEKAFKADDWPKDFAQRLKNDEVRLVEGLEAARNKMLACSNCQGLA